MATSHRRCRLGNQIRIFAFPGQRFVVELGNSYSSVPARTWVHWQGEDKDGHSLSGVVKTASKVLEFLRAKDLRFIFSREFQPNYDNKLSSWDDLLKRLVSWRTMDCAKHLTLYLDDISMSYLGEIPIVEQPGYVGNTDANRLRDGVDFAYGFQNLRTITFECKNLTGIKQIHYLLAKIFYRSRPKSPAVKHVDIRISEYHSIITSKDLHFEIEQIPWKEKVPTGRKNVEVQRDVKVLTKDKVPEAPLNVVIQVQNAIQDDIYKVEEETLNLLPVRLKEGFKADISFKDVELNRCRPAGKHPLVIIDDRLWLIRDWIKEGELGERR